MTVRESFDQLAREHDAMIRRIAAAHESRPALAQELVQDIYLALWRALPSFRGDCSLRSYVARIATNRAVTHVLRARSTPRTMELTPELGEALAAPGDNPEASAVASSRQARLVEAVRRLPLAYRQAVMLTLEGLAPREVAEVLGISANAVAIRLTRARDMLRSLMGEDR